MKNWTAIPNFVDTSVFHPRGEDVDWLQFRENYGIPADALVFGCAAAVKKHHKRIDYLIREFAVNNHEKDWPQKHTKDTKNNNHETPAFVRLRRGRHQTHEREEIATKGHKEHKSNHNSRSTIHDPRFAGTPGAGGPPPDNGPRTTDNGQRTNDGQRPPYLIIAGSRQQDSDELVQLAQNLAGDRIKIVFDLSREDMPVFYRACDCFLLTSLFEMMPIAVLEALATGLPVIANQHPVLEWMVGPGGATINMADEGGLSNFLATVTPEWLCEKGKFARQHALDNFSKDAVIQQYIDYYKEVLGPWSLVLSPWSLVREINTMSHEKQRKHR